MLFILAALFRRLAFAAHCQARSRQGKIQKKLMPFKSKKLMSLFIPFCKKFLLATLT
jgi:hypothetical protein